jgi:hypothetical protein
VVLALFLGGVLETWNTTSIHSLHSILDAQTILLPARVQVEGEVKNVHYSGTALVFELENNGKITCYWRHPNPYRIPLAHDKIVVLARIESTPNGRLCVVEEVKEYVFS